MGTERIVIMGAAGRDFHDFNTVFRGDPASEVVAFTHTQTQNIGELDTLPERRYPPNWLVTSIQTGFPFFRRNAWR